MSEEERIISSIKPIVNARKTHKDNNLYSLQLNAYQLDMIQGLLDLYNKEKEKNKKCEYYEMVADELYKNSISKDKIKNKIEDLEDNMILFTNDKEKFNRYKYARDVLEKILGE